MSALETIGAFGQGFGGGVQQGMDIYDRYQQMQDEGQKRQRTQRVEARVKDLIDQGGFDNGPDGLDQTAQFWLDEGDTENYLKYSQTAKQIRHADAATEGWNAFAVGQQDPVAGFELMNKMHEKLGDGVTWQVTQDPTSGQYQVVSSVNGKATPTTVKDRDALEHMLLSSLEPTLFADAKDYGAYKQTQAEGALATAKTQGELAIQPYKIQEAQANIQQSTAAAGASGATAAATMAKLPAEIENLGARTRQADATAAAAGKTPEENISSYVDRTTPKPDAMSDEPASPFDDPIVRSQLGSAISAANPQIGGPHAVAIGDQLLRAPDFQVNPETGEAKLPGGMVVKIGTAAIAQLQQARQMAQPPAQ